MTAQMTMAEGIRVLVAQFDEEGIEPAEIAARVGIPTGRVEVILDALDAPHDKVERSDVGMVAARPKARERTAQHGTLSGYSRHAKDKEKPCEPCAVVRRDYERERQKIRRAEAKAQPEQQPEQQPAPRVSEVVNVPVIRRDALPAVVPTAPPVITVGPARPMPSARTRTIVRWLVPRGEDIPAGTRVEYGLQHRPGGPVVPVSEATAEVEASTGATVYRRTVTDWVVAS